MKHAGSLIITTPSDRELAMIREFDAPRRLVFEAWTRPELLKQWLGVFGGWSLAECEVDLRVGGSFRFVWHGTGGKKMGMSGVYREIVVPERIVNTESFDDPWYEGEAVGTLELVEKGGRTTATQTVLYASREVRDAVLASGMERGVSASYDKLEEILAQPA